MARESKSMRAKYLIAQMFLLRISLSHKNSWKDASTMCVSTCAVVMDFKQYLTLSPELSSSMEHTFMVLRY